LAETAFRPGPGSATLSAYRSALSHYFAFCSQNTIEPENARFEDLAAYISPQLPSMPFPAASATLQLRLSAIRLWYGFLIYQDICSLNPSASFVKADRVAHMMSVLIDHDPDAVSLTGPAIYYDLGDSYCMNPF